MFSTDPGLDTTIRLSLRAFASDDQARAGDREQVERFLSVLSVDDSARARIRASVAVRYGRIVSVREQYEQERARQIQAATGAGVPRA